MIDLELEQNFMNITNILKAKSDSILSELKMADMIVKSYNTSKDLQYH